MTVLKVMKVTRSILASGAVECKMYLRGPFYTWVVTKVAWRYIDGTDFSIRVEGRRGSSLIYSRFEPTFSSAANLMNRKEDYALELLDQYQQ